MKDFRYNAGIVIGERALVLGHALSWDIVPANLYNGLPEPPQEKPR
jgi:hypothetical protein